MKLFDHNYVTEHDHIFFSVKWFDTGLPICKFAQISFLGIGKNTLWEKNQKMTLKREKGESCHILFVDLVVLLCFKKSIFPPSYLFCVLIIYS